MVRPSKRKRHNERQAQSRKKRGNALREQDCQRKAKRQAEKTEEEKEEERENNKQRKVQHRANMTPRRTRKRRTGENDEERRDGHSSEPT